MNDNRSLHDEFAAEARRLPVTSTGIEVILETAGRRRRRRNVAAVGSVLTVTAVTVVGIQQLSRVDDADIPSASDTVAPVATIPPPEVTATSVYYGPDQSMMDLSGAVAAEASAPVMTWTSYGADSPEALALTYGGADQRYALATEPGGNQPSRNALYEQQDGEWVKVADDVLPEGLRQAAVSGDSIYAIGTAPATAGAEPGAVGRYDIATQSWDLLALPEEARPYRTDQVSSSAEMSIAPIEGGALVVINRGAAYVDYRAVETAPGAPGAINDFQWVDGQLEVMSNCDQALLDERMTSLYEANGQPSSFEAEYRAAMAELCTVTTLTAADLGLSAADQAELERTPGAFMYRFDGNTLTPVESPIPDGSGISMQRNVLMGYTSDGTKAWLVQPDATFTPVFADLGSLDGTSIREIDGTVTTGANSVVISGAVGEAPSLVDLSNLLTDDTMQSPNTWLNGVASNGAATVAVASIEYRRADAIAEPTTIEGSTYDLVVDPNNGVSVIERATGRQLANGYRLATEPGSLRLVAPAGGELAYSDTSATTIVPGTVPASTIVYPAATTLPFESGPEDVLDEFAVDWQTLAPWSQAQTTKIASSIDGRSYAVESFADLVGAGPDERTELHSVDIVDGRFVLRGWVNDGGGTGRSVILIGTPNG